MEQTQVFLFIFQQICSTACIWRQQNILQIYVFSFLEEKWPMAFAFSSVVILHFLKIFFVIGNNLHLCIIFNLVVLVPMFCHLWFSSLLTSVIFMMFRFYFIPFFKVIFSHQKADWVWFSHCISSPLPFLIAFGTIYSPHFDVNCVVFVTTQKTCKCWLMIAFNF